MTIGLVYFLTLFNHLGKNKEQREENEEKEKRRELKKRGGKNRRGCTKAEFNLK
jgi:hypothetical protein